jgi:hypothetical protein
MVTQKLHNVLTENVLGSRSNQSAGNFLLLPVVTNYKQMSGTPSGFVKLVEIK